MSEQNAVQNPLIKYVSEKEIGWEYVNRDKAVELRRGETGFFFYDLLKEQIIRLNPGIVDEAKADGIIKDLENVRSSIEGNSDVLRYLKGEKSVYHESEKREVNIKLIDFKNIANNRFHVTDEWQYTNGTYTNRGDVILLINGIPVIIVETKGAHKKEGIAEGVDQIRRYHRETPEFVTHNQIFDVTHMLDFYYGVTWNLDRKGLFKWKGIKDEIASLPEFTLSEANVVARNDNNQSSFEKKVKTFFDRERILKFIKDYIVFFRKDDVLFKIILRQHQTRAVEKVIERARDKVKRTGLIWHTQGSGKTFTMIVAAEKILKEPLFEKPTVIMLVDRNELESQLFRNLDAYGFKDGEGMEIADSKKDLERLLSSNYRGLIVSMIHKFEHMKKDINMQDNIFVLIDEAHRTTSSDLGNYLVAALPNATYFGFTGTPIDKITYGRGTFKVFGKDDEKGYLDKYTIAESIEDGTTVPLHYALAPSEIRVPQDMLEKEFYALMEQEGVTDVDELNKLLERSVNLRNFLKSDERVQKVAEFVAKHYRENVEPMGYKAFLVGVDREACALYKKEMDKHLPSEYSTVVYSKGHNDTDTLTQYYLTEDKEKRLKGKIFPKKETLPKILIVTDKLLTGYDAPILYCMYLDKPMKDHTLLQAIARVNRPYEDDEGLKKPSGFVLDFVGIFEKLEKALAFDSDVVGSVIQNISVLKEAFISVITNDAKEYERFIQGRMDDKVIEQAVEYFTDKDKRETFYKFYKRLEMLYEIISPDKDLRDYMDKYLKLSSLYTIIRNAFSKRVVVDKELMRKTQMLVRKAVENYDIPRPYKIYEIKEDTLQALKKDDDSDNTKVINLRKSIEKFVLDNEDSFPYLISIGERAEVVVELYDDRQISTQEALTRLEKVIEEINQAKKEQAEKNFDAQKFTVYWILKKEGIENADELAVQIDSAFSQSPYWQENAKEARELTASLYKILLKTIDKDKAVGLVDKILKIGR
ncbi:MAG: Type I restriction enzyme EcoR124II R protein [Actinobacteria bacterium]|nr:Type I restriction enzyme EcoR124II R protein [Actinomycetota bacterium]